MIQNFDDWIKSSYDVVNNKEIVGLMIRLKKLPDSAREATLQAPQVHKNVDFVSRVKVVKAIKETELKIQIISNTVNEELRNLKQICDHFKATSKKLHYEIINGRINEMGV